MAYHGHCRLALAPLRRPLFGASAALYGGIQLLTRGLHQPLPGWVTSWLADALAMPVILTLALVVQRLLRRRPQLVLPDAWLLAAWLYVSLWFELLAPWLRPARYTADWLDVLAYALGTWAFRRWLNRPA
ncbi:magnesium citrate secondary transporter [Hymenobacter jeollabukensis]|uniref:Magnesium citrate secondary transporter n=1 Tax=Hymenobacter jeollabukensis TaxID=2025313 RepID=A0A5R8WQ65_9BACT|nr:magnesium citrate secondary transporter [Hymenobacter jeollabukensis]TLM91913.1 magnesium citrate secondary transporter [Hymenobacter jeollabukensis]